MKKTIAKCLAFGLLGSLLVAGNAMALSLTLSSDDGGFVHIIDDGIGSGPDTDPDNWVGAGVIQYNGAVGSNWWINTTTGFSYTAIGTATFPEMDLVSGNTSQTGGTLTMVLSDQYATVGALDAAVEGFLMTVGGTTQGTFDIDFVINGVSVGDNYGTGAFAGTFQLGGVPGADADVFDMQIIATITHDGNDLTSFDANIEPVPEPASMLLLGTGLMGLAGAARRKKKAA